MRRPGIEPGPSAWKADILTTRPTTRGGETCAGKPLKKENYLIEYKMDLSGFEPEAFCMQSRRDTTTPQAPVAVIHHLCGNAFVSLSRRKTDSSGVRTHALSDQRLKLAP